MGGGGTSQILRGWRGRANLVQGGQNYPLTHLKNPDYGILFPTPKLIFCCMCDTGIQHQCWSQRHAAQWWSEAAHCHRPCSRRGPQNPAAGRSHLCPGHGERESCPRGAGQSQGGSHEHCHRSPALHHLQCRLHRGHQRRDSDRIRDTQGAHGEEGSLLQAQQIPSHRGEDLGQLSYLHLSAISQSYCFLSLLQDYIYSHKL